MAGLSQAAWGWPQGYGRAAGAGGWLEGVVETEMPPPLKGVIPCDIGVKCLANLCRIIEILGVPLGLSGIGAL